MQWYKGELLNMAKDVGYRLLPAFNTTTGIPHSRVHCFYYYCTIIINQCFKSPVQSLILGQFETRFKK